MEDKVINGYKVFGRIGEGAHGLVLKAIHQQDGRQVALKKLMIKNLDDGIPINVFREIMTLRHLRCKYVTKLYEMFPHGMSLVLVLEYMSSSLWEMLRKHQEELTIPVVKCYTICMLKGLNYMHHHCVMHRDLKPANLLINSQGVLKIGDLGLARLFWPEGGRPYSHQVASRWYRAPELLYGARFYNQSIDLWAVGCIVAEMITKKPLFAGESDIEQLAIVLRHLGTPTTSNWPGVEELPDFNKITFPESSGTPWSELLPDFSQDAMDFVTGFLLYDGDKRTTAENALNDDWFRHQPLPASIETVPKPKDRVPRDTST